MYLVPFSCKSCISPSWSPRLVAISPIPDGARLPRGEYHWVWNCLSSRLLLSPLPSRRACQCHHSMSHQICGAMSSQWHGVHESANSSHLALCLDHQANAAACSSTPPHCNNMVPPRAEHGCGSSQVTHRYTRGNTCKDPHLRIQITRDHRSLRIQVWVLAVAGIPVGTSGLIIYFKLRLKQSCAQCLEK